MISRDFVIGMNEAIEGVSIVKVSLVDSALSSWHYYDNEKDKISSIIRGLIKNHPFKDGNKRTADSYSNLSFIKIQFALKI